MNQEPTPGPWMMCEARATGEIMVRSCENPPLLIANVIQSPNRFHTAKANAVLIASAPDLLKTCGKQAETIQALKAALEDLMTWQNGPPLPTYEEGWNRAMQAAQEALTR